MSRQLKNLVTMLSAKAADGIGANINVTDFRHILLEFGTASSANMTVKFQGSLSDTAPDFSAAQSVSNHWDYIGVYDLQSGNIIAGDTGIALAAADDFRLLMVNTDGLKWVNAIVSSYVAGSVTVKVRCFND